MQTMLLEKVGLFGPSGGYKKNSYGQQTSSAGGSNHDELSQLRLLVSEHFCIFLSE